MKLKMFISPFKNKKAMGGLDTLIYGLFVVIIFNLLLYGLASYLHNSTTRSYNMLANSLVDSACENREINTAMEQYYSEQVSRFDWYAKENTITIETISFKGNKISKKVVGIIRNGKPCGEIKLDVGSIVHVEISSGKNNYLTKMSNLILGEDETSIQAIGFGEGLVR